MSDIQPDKAAPAAPTATADKAATASQTTPPGSAPQPNNPLHGFTLQRILELLLEHNGGFSGLAKLLKLNCFTNQPSISSSLKFLRKTPWARTEVEQLFIRQQLYLSK